MGTAPPSKPLEEPARPFKREQRRASCLQHTFLPKPRKDSTVLLHLISRREWQKVLIRVTLFPSEVTQRQRMTWYGVQWSLIPLHLACALQPPPEVVSILLRFHSDTARVRMNRCSLHPYKKKRWRRRNKQKKHIAPAEQNNYALYRSDRRQLVPKIDTAPSNSSDDEQEDLPHYATMETEKAHNRTKSDRGSLLKGEAFAMEGDKSRLHVFETYDDDSMDSDEKHSAVAVPPEMLPDYEESPAPDYAVADGNAKAKSFRDHGVAFQLSSSGSIEPLNVAGENANIPSKMQWNLDPLLMEADALLPLHIACLYRASPGVISSLLKAYPKAAEDLALGMLPIHMACASFELPPPLLALPPGPVPFPHYDEFDMAETIRRLEQAFPESLDYPSESNGMTPRMYIDETLDDGSFKDTCLEALGAVKEESIEDEEATESRASDFDNTTLTTRVPDEVHCDGDDSTLPSCQTETSSRYLGQNLPQINGSSGSRLYTQMVTKDWENALATIEERPKEGRKWQYGIELDRIEAMNSAIMWKRLPIHSACVLHAPIGVIEALIWAYPRGIRVKDPFTGSLPLHMACRHSASPELVKSVVMAYPTGSRIKDNLGRLPLHMACLSGASRLTFIYLLKAYPHAVLIKDDRHRTPLRYAKKNPTLKPETVELLQLVHHFLEKQPAVEDDYIFEGFSTPRSSLTSDDASAASSFYEETLSISRHSPRVGDRLSGSPSSGSHSSQEINANVESLAEEFSSILEERSEAQDEDGDISGRVTPKFGVSLAKRSSKHLPETELSPLVGDGICTENSKPSTDEKVGAAATLTKLVDLGENERTAEPSTESEELVAEDTGNVEISDTPKIPTEEEGATVTLTKLVFLSSNKKSEQAAVGTSVNSSLLKKDLSSILEECSASEEESQDEESENDFLPSNKQSSRTHDAESMKIESSLDRLSKLLTANKDGLIQSSSVACLDGDVHSSSTEVIDSVDDVVEVNDSQSISNDLADDSKVPSHEVGSSKDSCLVEPAEVVEDTDAQISQSDAENDLTEVEQEGASECPDSIENQGESKSRHDTTETDAVLPQATAEQNLSFPGVEIVPSAEKSNADANCLSADSKVEAAPSVEKGNVDDNNLLAKDDAPQLAEFAPADIAAGCSPLTVPVCDSLKGGTVATTLVRSSIDSSDQPTVLEQYMALEEVEPLVDESASLYAAETVVHQHNRRDATKNEDSQVSTTCENPVHDQNKIVASTEKNAAVTSDIKSIGGDSETFERVIDAVFSLENDQETCESEETRAEGSTELQVKAKSDLSQSVESTVDVESVPPGPQQPVVNAIQERDDQDKTNSPTQEERLDIHAC